MQTSDDGLYLTRNTNTFFRSRIKNFNAGSSAGAGHLNVNDVDEIFQYYMGSSTNAFVPHGSLISTNGTGGMHMAFTGTGATYSIGTSQTKGFADKFVLSATDATLNTSLNLPNLFVCDVPIE